MTYEDLRGKTRAGEFKLSSSAESLCAMLLNRMSLCVLLAGIVAAHRAVYSPRILSPHNADAYSLKTFAEFPHWRDLHGDAKVFEINIDAGNNGS